jgi:hypothetical protein
MEDSKTNAPGSSNSHTQVQTGIGRGAGGETIGRQQPKEYFNYDDCPDLLIFAITVDQPPLR